ALFPLGSPRLLKCSCLCRVRKTKLGYFNELIYTLSLPANNKGMVYITRREHFNAAHRLFRPEWTDEQNLEQFGKCANPNWHGHNYSLYITVKGEIDSQKGYCINLKDLSRIIRTSVTDKLDHTILN